MHKISIIIFLCLINLAYGQTKTPLLILSNLDGALYIDGENMNISINKNIPYKTTVSFGDHLIQVNNNGTIATETINCTNATQKIVKVNFDLTQISSNKAVPVNSSTENPSEIKSNANTIKFVKVTDEIVTVHSTSSFAGGYRNVAEINLPDKCSEYIYRLSIYPTGESENANSLISLLKEIDPEEISMMNSFSQYAVKNKGYSVDAFIFNNNDDKYNFMKGSPFHSCQSFLNKSNCCFAEKTCIGRTVYFGFRNNSLLSGVDVRVEVVALIDKSSNAKDKFSYTIENVTQSSVKFSLSKDNINWSSESLGGGYSSVFNVEQDYCFIKIVSGVFKTVNYKIYAGRKYKIFWNTNVEKWDVTEY